LNNLAIVLHDKGDLAAAQEYYDRALTIRTATLGEGHPLTAQSLSNLAFLYHDRGDTERALDLSRRVLAIYRTAYPGDHPDIAYSLQNLAGWLVEDGDYAGAEPLFDEALAMHRRLVPADHPDIAITQSAVALLRLQTGHAAEALEAATAAGTTLDAAYGRDHWRSAWAHVLEGAALAALGRLSEAEPQLRSAYDVLSHSSGARPSQLTRARQCLGDLYAALDRPDEAARYRSTVAATP
jgi:Flp pilus assembly protein TadD